ncbi:MAG: sulfatase [Verrucomicrobiales bacterium]|nr:sulfatase [Verrucomicrobiales bacterium]
MPLRRLSLLFFFTACLLHARAADRPNMILFIADDVSWNDIGCYGNAAARTPTIDRLAATGRRFDEAYLTASSCSPSRSSIITGRYPHNNGRASELHQPISAHLPWFPRLLREAGYYTALVGKNHMTASGESPQPPAFDLIDPGKIKGNSGGHAQWVQTVQQRPKDKPFFFWFAANDAHRDWDADKEWRPEEYGPKHRPEDVVVPPYLIDDAATREDLASYYNEVTRFDHYIGQVVAELEKEGTLDNTLIFILADNGRPFPRAKTRLHDSGMKTYLVAHWPAGLEKPGAATESLASAIDLAPTYLEAAGVQAPASFQGVSLLPILKDPSAIVRQHVFSEHNWHDYEAHGRAIRSEGFLYLRNNRPQFASQGPADSVRSPSFTSLKSARDANRLNDAQADVFQAPRPTEELYRTAADPKQLHNLAADPDYAAVKARLASLLDAWTEQTGDDVPENISADSFDRETGESLLKKGDRDSFRGTPPGSAHDAPHLNTPGPR